ncbi:LemA family protein [Pseudomonas sichuanensis]|uniref:LemA family protein n=1 Tax=Pseudomonas sichuanensis TaxID=2213015 RepID=UPI002ABC685A|nr:LemA family protein [Pseudomonas sichuanensis]MDZ4020999.1 hypothetical protein [Pseudomonas sichuanensis]
MEIIFVLLFICLLFILAIAAIYNSIIEKGNAAKRAWADVHTYERGKLEVLEPLQQLLPKYTGYEHNLLERITSLRSGIGSLTENADVSLLKKIETMSHELTSALKVSVEAYPELKASDLYKQLMSEISDQQENVNAAIAIYNLQVERFNNGIQTFPANLVNEKLTKRTAITPFNDENVTNKIGYRPNF